ncbi:hypothetical protein [Nocardia stercoris]|uniref:Uncharacterized protein n=1 Tax=Nocardia stercoris TaxID=2483361 RepID=A0A3M2KZC7_9NOCA|nr:hypothetical protein [Nocardia stercoris]RMI30847.1 hypothetical protein EBN03_19545 [Nocardia stercoris]
MKKLLLAAAAASGALLLAPTALAHAEWPAEDDGLYGWNAYSDRTGSFVSVFDARAWLGGGSSAQLALVSPYGVSHPIECRGDGHYVRMHACQQLDNDGNWHELDSYPIGPWTLYAYR